MEKKKSQSNQGQKKKKEYWSGLLFPTPGDLPNPGIEPQALVSPVLAGRFFTIRAIKLAKHAPSFLSPFLLRSV